jgi:hypothetical protein
VPNKKSFRKTSRYQKSPDPLGHLFRLVLLIILLTVGIFVVIMKFAPKIGGFFGLISVNRNKDTTIDAAVQPPLFVDVPESTNSSKVTIKGVSEPTTTVKLFVNGPERDSVLADISGEFIFTDVPLTYGKNTIFAKSITTDNKESDPSEIIKIEVDKESPTIDIDSPKNGETVKNLNKRILVEGKVNEKSAVKVNGRTAIIKPDLSFELLVGVEEGSVEIKVEAIDTAGNKSEKKIYVSYEKKSS